MARGVFIAIGLLVALCSAWTTSQTSLFYYAQFLEPAIQARLIGEDNSEYPLPKASQMSKELFPTYLQGKSGLAVNGEPSGHTLSEAMGLALMSAGFYWDMPALEGLTVGWQAMTQGIAGGSPLGGCADVSKPGNCLCGTVSGADMPAWSFPLNSCSGSDCRGSATSGDQDAITGILSFAEITEDDSIRELGVKMIAAFVEDDIGGGSLGAKANSRPVPVVGDVPKELQKMFLWRGGSCWGGYDTSSGDSNLDLCINPARFSPGQWRYFAKYVQKYPQYVPKGFTAQGIADTLNSAIVWGYNLLERISCPSSGLVSNWWTVPTAGWPWQGKLQCSNFGSNAGEFGADALTVMWRVALDAQWFGNEGSLAPHFNENGKIDGYWGAANYSLRVQRKYRELINNVSSRCPAYDCLPLKRAEPLLQRFPACDACPKGVTVDTASPRVFWAPLSTFCVEDEEQITKDETAQWVDFLAYYNYNFDDNPQDFIDLTQRVLGAAMMGGASPKFPAW